MPPSSSKVKSSRNFLPQLLAVPSCKEKRKKKTKNKKQKTSHSQLTTQRPCWKCCFNPKEASLLESGGEVCTKVPCALGHVRSNSLTPHIPETSKRQTCQIANVAYDTKARHREGQGRREGWSLASFHHCKTWGSFLLGAETSSIIESLKKNFFFFLQQDTENSFAFNI